MTHIIRGWLQSAYHRLLPGETRTRLYFLAPNRIKRVWDQLGSGESSQVSEKDVLFAARLLWLHEPSTETIEKWVSHAIRFNYDFEKLAHDMQFDIDASLNDHELKRTPLPVDIDTVNYAYRIFLNREPHSSERDEWLERLQESAWTYDVFVSSFGNSEEYHQRRRAESEPHLVELKRFKLYVRLEDIFTSAPIAHHKTYEPVITDLIDAIVRPGDYVIDVGANVGFHALNMAVTVGEHGKVFAFEPLPGNCELIKLSIEANSLTNLDLYPYAAGKEAGNIDILVEGNNTNARINSNPDHDSLTAKRFPVRVVKIDDCLKDIPQLRFVKIDVEGAEPLAIDGMSKLIARFKPALLFEYYPDFISMISQCDPEQFLGQIINYGYKLHIIDQNEINNESFEPSQITQAHIHRGRTVMDILALPEDNEIPRT